MKNNNNASESLSVLIIDDNPHNLQVVGTILREAGYKTAVAQSAQQAIDFIDRKTPDLILLDIVMPEMDGFELCAELKTIDRTRDIPVIFLTALTEKDAILSAFSAGGVDYITKPFIEEEVLARVNVHVQLRRSLLRLEAMSITDEMTGAYNRRFAHEMLARQMEISKREKTGFILCYIDVDNLKTINDRFGHEAGDKLITTVVDNLKDRIRPTDYLFRMGGDEFMILFTDTTIKAAEVLIHRLNRELNKQKIHDTVVDFSFGFSEYITGKQVSTESLITEADQMMYEFKQAKKASSAPASSQSKG